MTLYVPQTWANGVLGGTPINASRLQHIEDGLSNAAPLPPAGSNVIYVNANGNDGWNGRSEGNAKLSLAAALAEIGDDERGVIVAGWGDIDCGNGVKFAGYRCGLIAQSGAGTRFIITGTQTGPVLDFTGWLHPGFEYMQRFGNFTVSGDGTAAPVIATVTNKQLTSNVITLTTDAPHGLSVGDTVWVRDVPPTLDGSTYRTFNGVKTLTAVTATTLSFRYAFTSSDIASAAATGSIHVAKCGVVFPHLTGISASDITVRDCGGPDFVYTGTQTSTFTNMVADTPIDAKANDIPYHYASDDCNGNTFINLGVRSSSANSDCGVSGAILFETDAFDPSFNVFVGPWIEALHVPDGGCLVHVKGNTNLFIHQKPFDSVKEAGATGTCSFRFDAPGHNNLGGNMVYGYIPGSQGGSDLDSGIELNQSGNHILGVAGYNGTNIIIASGVNRSGINFIGAYGVTTNPAVVDNSGTTTNSYSSMSTQSITWGDIILKRHTAGALAIQWPSDPTRGELYFGNGGARIQTAAGGATMYQTSDQWILRDLALVNLMVLDKSAAYSDNETALRIQRKLAGVQSLQRVSMGAADSGGAGFRLLRVPN